MAYAPEWLAFEELLGFRPRLEGNSENIFRQWDEIGTAAVNKLTFPNPDPSVKREDRIINDDNIKVRVYTPPGTDDASKDYPLCFYVHGGGWIFGDLDIEDGPCSELCKRCSMVVVSVDYRLAPQYKCPVALNDCVAGYHWAVNNATSIKASLTKIIIAGGSAGANLAIGTALKLIDTKAPVLPTAMLALVPVTIDPLAIPDHLTARYTSYEENSDTGPNSPSGMRGFIDAYGAQPGDKYFSVLLHDKLNELPRTYIAICGKDTLRDDSRLFVEALESAGVSVRSKEYAGFPHYFWTWPAPSLREVSRKFNQDCTQAVQWLLE